MLWEVEIRSASNQTDREAARVLSECRDMGAGSVRKVRSARSFLIQGNVGQADVERIAAKRADQATTLPASSGFVTSARMVMVRSCCAWESRPRSVRLCG